MQQKGMIAVAVVAILVVAGAGVYLLGQGDGGNGGTETDGLKDFAGREVVPVENLDGGIVAIGQDTFRWMTYFGLADRCVMVDQNDMTNFLGKSFMYVGRAQVDIDGGNSATLTGSDEARKYFTHTNCGVTADDVRTIIGLKPSIVVVPENFYTDYRNEMSAIEAEGINTLAIANIYTFLKEGSFEITDDLSKQIDVLSKALKMEKRGAELKNAFKTVVDDIRSLVPAGKERTAYIGSVAYNGAHGISSSVRWFLPFELAGVKNIIGGSAEYADSGVKEYSASTIGRAIEDDTILFVDASGLTQNTDNTSKGVISMFQGHEAYLLTPYIWTGMNYENVFVAAYQVIMHAYGDDVLTESGFREKVDRVHDLFYGTHESTRDISVFKSYTVDVPAPGTSVYDDMNALYGVAKGHPIHGALTVNADGTLTL